MRASSPVSVKLRWRGKGNFQRRRRQGRNQYRAKTMMKNCAKVHEQNSMLRASTPGAVRGMAMRYGICREEAKSEVRGKVYLNPRSDQPQVQPYRRLLRLRSRRAEDEAEEQTGQQQEDGTTAADDAEKNRIKKHPAQRIQVAEEWPQPQGYHDAEGQ